jgi:hypothetical protein
MFGALTVQLMTVPLTLFGLLKAIAVDACEQILCVVGDTDKVGMGFTVVNTVWDEPQLAELATTL